MIIIFPLSHENSTVKRLPLITYLLIAVNVILFAVTVYKAPKTTERLANKEILLLKYYYDHPYLDLPDGTEKKLFSSRPKLKEDIEKKDEEKEPPADYQVRVEQEMLDQAVEKFEDAYSHEFYRKYGYIPAVGGIKPLLFSMFLHGGFFHLFFNMFFLFLSGFSLEDRWGRVMYLLFYLTGGVVATWIHGAMHPQSYVPLVGASGAVAALMGAFLIRFFSTRIYFFYFVLIFVKFWYGRFLARAYIMLPLWLLSQLYFALTDKGSGGGVAFWAHIGGFVFGMGVAGLVRLVKFEESLLRPSIEKKVTVYDAERTRETEPGGTGAKDTPEIALEHRNRAASYLESGQEDKAIYECKRALVVHLKNNQAAEAVSYYRDICRTFPGLTLKPDYQMKLVGLLERHGHVKDAAMACKRLYLDQKKNGDKKSLAMVMARYASLLQHFPGQSGQVEKLITMARRLDSTVRLSEKRPVTKKQARVAAPAPAAPEPPPDSGESNETKPVADSADMDDPPLSVVPQSRIVSVELLSTKPAETLLTVEPHRVSRTSMNRDELILNGSSRGTIPYSDIRFITAFQMYGESHFNLDLFVAGEMRPYRINSNRIAYNDIFDEPFANTLESFKQFIIRLMGASTSLYTDRETRLFAENAKIKVYAGDGKLTAYEKMIWSRLKG